MSRRLGVVALAWVAAAMFIVVLFFAKPDRMGPPVTDVEPIPGEQYVEPPSMTFLPPR